MCVGFPYFLEDYVGCGICWAPGPPSPTPYLGVTINAPSLPLWRVSEAVSLLWQLLLAGRFSLPTSQMMTAWRPAFQVPGLRHTPQGGQCSNAAFT
jgi:hypothetical protein